IGLFLSGAALVAGWGAVALRWANEGRRRVAYALAIALALVAAGELLFGAVIPKLLQLVRNAGATATEGHGLLPGGLGNVLAISGGSVAGLLGALVAGLRQPSAGAEPSGGKALGGLLRRGFAHLREPLVNAAIAVLGPLLAGVLLLVFVNLGAYKTPLTPEWHWTWAVAVYSGALLGAGFLWKRADLVAWSLHPIYKRRLARAFAVRRIGSGAQVIGAEEIPYDQLPPLSKSQPPDFPELLVCAAANLSDYGKTPAGSNVASFVFSAARVGGGLMGEWNTEDLERLMNRNGRRDLTLFTAIAVSGAAVSPAMGKMTRRPLRFLLALGNVRLGIWLPNPLKSETFADLPKDQPVFARPHYFFAELFGLNQLHHRYLYVSDGGHYENLGLVELLRRQCRTIWCVDASGDKEDTFSTIGQAIAIARAEHLVDDIEISPQEMAPDPKGDPRTVRRTHQTGQIRYSDGTTGKLVVIKIGVPATAPWDVTAFQRRNRFFPCDSTANQLYTAERFEAYRALGYYATMRALEEEAGVKERTVNLPVATDTEAAEAMARVLLQRLFEPVKMEVS